MGNTCFFSAFLQCLRMSDLHRIMNRHDPCKLLLVIHGQVRHCKVHLHVSTTLNSSGVCNLWGIGVLQYCPQNLFRSLLSIPSKPLKCFTTLCIPTSFMVGLAGVTPEACPLCCTRSFLQEAPRQPAKLMTALTGM